MTRSPWIEVDRKGLAQIVANRPKSFILYELIQNALDEPGVTTVSVTIEHAGHGCHKIIVEDDAPDGYHDLRHAWTLYAPSKKKGDATLRGRFNAGCKTILALATDAEIRSTRGGVRFSRDKGRQNIREKRVSGTEFSGFFRMSIQDAERAVNEAFRVLPPKGIEVTINGVPIGTSTPFRMIELSLPTIVADDEGVLRQTVRKTIVEVHRPDDEVPTLYELGIPVVELGDGFPYHLDVQQRVPLNQDRDNVTPAYLRRLLVAVLNELHDEIEGQKEASAPWISEASSSPDCTSEALEAVLTARYGEDRVAFDPSDPEANKIATAAGKTVVHGGSLTSGQWSNIRRDRDLLLPAGKLHPSPKVEISPDGIPPVPRDEWSATMIRISKFANELWAVVGNGSPLTTTWYNSRSLGFSGAWGKRAKLSLNYSAIKKEIKEFNNDDPRGVIALLIHEFAHEKESDHLSRNYFHELCRIGAELAISTLPPTT